MLGLALPTDIIQTCLGVTILGIAVLLFFLQELRASRGQQAGRRGPGLGHERCSSSPAPVKWWTGRPTAPLAGLLLFIVIGIMAGMSGLGAGWANVPVLNLLMGRAAEGQRGYLQVPALHHRYFRRLGLPEPGLRDPADTIPSIVGLMLGSVVVRLFAKAKPQVHPYHGHRRVVFLAPRRC